MPTSPASAATSRSSVRSNASLVISLLALVVATSGTAFAVGHGSVHTKDLARDAVTTAKIKNGAVTTAKIGAGSVTASRLDAGAVTGGALAAGSVGSAAVKDHSLRLRDLGGGVVSQVATTQQSVTVSAGQCKQLQVGSSNPTPPGVLGSVVVGTLTTPAGDPVLDNSGFVLPTLVTGTSQGGALYDLAVCAGSGAETVPAGSVVTYSLIAP